MMKFCTNMCSEGGYASFSFYFKLISDKSMVFKELMANASIVTNVTLMLMTVPLARIVLTQLVRLNVSVSRALKRSILNVLISMNVIPLVLATVQSKHVSTVLAVTLVHAMVVTS